MNWKLRITETPHNQTHNQTTQNKHYHKKGKSRKFKENYEQWKDYLTIIKKHRMENS